MFVSIPLISCVHNAGFTPRPSPASAFVTNGMHMRRVSVVIRKVINIPLWGFSQFNFMRLCSTLSWATAEQQAREILPPTLFLTVKWRPGRFYRISFSVHAYLQHYWHPCQINYRILFSPTSQHRWSASSEPYFPPRRDLCSAPDTQQQAGSPSREKKTMSAQRFEFEKWQGKIVQLKIAT